jgi:hypothetical protein
MDHLQGTSSISGYRRQLSSMEDSQKYADEQLQRSDKSEV